MTTRSAKRRFEHPASLWRAGTRAATCLAWIALAGLSATAQAQAPDQPSPPPPRYDLGTMGQLLAQLTGGPARASSDAGGEWSEQTVSALPADAEVRQTDTGLLDVHVRDTDIATLLEMLSYEAHANIVTSTSVRGQINANLYAVTLEQALEALLAPNGFAFYQTGTTIFVGTPDEIAILRPPPETRVLRLRYIRPAEAAAAVKAVLSKDAAVVEGGTDTGRGATAATMTPAGVDYIIVTDHADRLDAAAAVLAEVDHRPKQVLIEATILRATLNETNELGIDFTMLGGVDFQNVSSTSNASANLTTGLLPEVELQDTTFNINTNFAGSVSDGGFTFGLIKDSIAAFVRALEEVTDVVVVANPKIIALNKQEGEVIVGRRDGYLTTTVTETAAVQTVEFLETGTQVKFRPFINDDGTVRLAVHPKDSNGGLTAANLPFEETTEAHADILVNDGHTVLIGGLFRERTVSTKSQLPLLGDIPGMGLLFGNRNDQTTREEVIILLTVHILKETPQEQEHFRELLEDVERVRVGSRRGLLATGRERLAQACFQEAVERYEAGDRDRALLNVRMALHNQPKHLAAIKLRERLLEERLWDDDGTKMRAFIWSLIEPGPHPTLVPEPRVFARPEVLTAPLPDEPQSAAQGAQP